MTREEAKKLKPFQIVRWNGNVDDYQDKEYKWVIPHCGKIAVVTQVIVWEDGGEEIHLRFPEKRFKHNEFYDNIDDFNEDWKCGHDLTLSEGFDTGAEHIDIIV